MRYCLQSYLFFLEHSQPLQCTLIQLIFEGGENKKIRFFKIKINPQIKRPLYSKNSWGKQTCHRACT